MSLMVDIQEKLRAGKGAGYQRWATGFNLKQMAQTMNYLSEHKLLDYKVLSEKTAAATARYNELSAQIKAAEKRMTEIAVLRTTSSITPKRGRSMLPIAKPDIQRSSAPSMRRTSFTPDRKESI